MFLYLKGCSHDHLTSIMHYKQLELKWSKTHDHVLSHQTRWKNEIKIQELAESQTHRSINQEQSQRRRKMTGRMAAVARRKVYIYP